MSAWLDTKVRLSGARQGQVLAGAATIERGDLHLTRTESQPDLHPTGPLKDVVFVDKEAQRERRRKEAGQPGGGAAPVGPVPATRVKLRLPGPFHVRGPELDIELQGELDAEVVDGQARVLGTVGASKGWVEITGRRYALLRANASFDGSADVNPALDIRLEREVKNATLVIKIKGTARSPRIEMRAEPPIYDQSQVLTMILSGESGHEDQGDQAVERKLVNAVANTLTNALIGQIRKGLGGYLPVEVIKVDLGFQGSSVVQPRVEVGKYILNRLYLSYVYQFGAQVGARRANTHEAHLDLSILQNLSLLTLFGDAAVGAVKLYWTRRF